MASAPFDINDTVPADNGIVSQFPLQERTFRDIVEDWILTNHNTNGRHDEVQLDHKADPGSGVASVTEVWASSTSNAAGALKVRIGEGNVEWLGVPPGAIIAYAADSAPEGWLLAYGQAVSRTTYARLFGVLSTTHGVGDGTTTFNLPDLRGRVIAGTDDMGGSSANRLVGSLTGSVNGDTFGATGGEEGHVITDAESASVPITITDPGHTHPLSHSSIYISSGSSGVNTAGVGGTIATVSVSSAVTGITAALNGALDNAHNTVQPTIILNYIIKT